MQLFILDSSVHMLLLFVFIFLTSWWPCAFTLCSLYVILRPVPPTKALSFSSFLHSLPLIFTLLSAPSSSIAHFCCASVSVHSAAYCTFSHTASDPPPILTVGMSGRGVLDGQSGASICLWPVYLTIDSVAWTHKICARVNITLLLFTVTCNSPCIL